MLNTVTDRKRIDSAKIDIRYTYRDIMKQVDKEDKTTIEFQYESGIFQTYNRITAFDGELNIHVHTTGGHKLNWRVTITQCDTPIKSYASDDYDGEEDGMGQVIDVLDKEFEDRSWWNEVRKHAEKWLRYANSPPKKDSDEAEAD